MPKNILLTIPTLGLTTSQMYDWLEGYFDANMPAIGKTEVHAIPDSTHHLIVFTPFLDEADSTPEMLQSLHVQMQTDIYRTLPQFEALLADLKAG